jgi:hypothetical protein
MTCTRLQTLPSVNRLLLNNSHIDEAFVLGHSSFEFKTPYFIKRNLNGRTRDLFEARGVPLPVDESHSWFLCHLQPEFLSKLKPCSESQHKRVLAVSVHLHSTFYIQYCVLSDVLAPFLFKKVSLVLVGDSFKNKNMFCAYFFYENT